MKKQTKIYSTTMLIALLLAILLAGCGGSGNMYKRKKSRCNTCPKFSYIETQYQHNDPSGNYS